MTNENGPQDNMSDDDLSKARQRRERRRTPPAGAFGPNAGKQARIDRVMDKVRDAERLNGPPTPERITAALDMCDLYGPQVDEALGGQEPMVDEWESGERIPTKEQVQALAWLTGFPMKFFYLPPPPAMPGVIICGDDGCRTLDR
jgi:hypothetical protein